MIDTNALIESTDLRDVLTAKLGDPNRAGFWHCPMHEEKTASFGIVKNRPHLWHCFSCGKTGDAIGFLREVQGLSFVDACNALANGSTLPELATIKRRPAPARVRQSEPPGELWAARAAEVAKDAARLLWEPSGAEGLDYLRGRGFDADTIRAARMGWIPEDRYEPTDAWGLQNSRPLFLPAGVLIPWYHKSVIFRLNVRRLTGNPKYIGPAGFKQGLYRPVHIRAGLPTVLSEGEFDALSIYQAAADLCDVAATGSATGGRIAREVYSLAACPRVLLAFDNDRAGDDAAQWWAEAIPHATRLSVPEGYKDPASMSREQLRAWIRAALGLPAEPKPKQWPPMPPGLNDEELERLAIMTVDGKLSDAEALEHIMEQRKEGKA